MQVKLASAGIESMAETGGKSALIAEVNGAIGAGHAEFLLSGNGIGRSPGQVELEFQVTDSYPLVTLVSMVAPSPDWFVGVSGVDLYEGGAWVQRLEVPLVVYDAGTDSGPSYTSANDDTDPADAISELTEAPFDGVQQVGTFVFELQSGVGVEADTALPDAFGSVAIYPNPSVDHVDVQVVPAVPGEVVVEVFDVLGRMVHRVPGSDGVAGVETRLGVDVQDWADGLYMVRVHERGEVGGPGFCCFARRWRCERLWPTAVVTGPGAGIRGRYSVDVGLDPRASHSPRLRKGERKGGEQG